VSDALTALRTALAPKTGLRRIPLTLESYQHQSTQLSSKLLTNMFAEQQPADARSHVALIPTPGLSLLLNVGTGPIHAINDDLPGTIYVVSGTHFYRLVYDVGTAAWVASDLGDIGTPSGGYVDDQRLYSIAVGSTAAVVCVPPNSYVTSGGSPVALITTTWPSYGASSVTHLDGYYVWTGQMDPTQFFISRLLDPSMVDALDFASLDAFPNAILKVLTLGSDLWFAGAAGWEIWYNAGNADFPFRRRANGVIQRSMGAVRSIAKGDKSLYWWSADNRIYRSVNYGEERISTHAIEAQAGGEITTAYVYNQLGHIHYTLNFLDRTLVYDTLTKVWHNASSTEDGNSPWRGSCSTANTGLPFIGDSAAGRLMVAEPLLSTDMGVAVRRQVVLPPLYDVGKRVYCSRLEVEMEVGGDRTPGDIVLEWSDDGGVTYTGSRVMNAGAVGQTRKRVFTTRLGSFRNRVFRLTSQHAMSVYALDADIVEGAH
jgi:hypothetical protein